MFRAMGLIGLLSLVSRLGTEHEEPLIRWAFYFSVAVLLRVWLQLEKEGVGQLLVFFVAAVSMSGVSSGFWCAGTKHFMCISNQRS